MKKISYCVFLSGLFAMACASAYSAQRPLKDIDIAVPGYGYLSVFDMPTLNSCLKNAGDAGSVTYSKDDRNFISVREINRYW